MSDWREDYWLEALNLAFEYADVDALSDEKMKIVAHSLVGSAENESMARAPTPSARDIENGEIARLKAAHAKEIEALEKRIDIYRKSVARRHGVSERAVYTDGYNVMIDPSG